MQISAPNFAASHQQAARPQKPASQPAPFEPLDFDKAERQSETEATAAIAPGIYVRPGSHVDIKI